MAKKAGSEVTTWVKYSQAKALAGEYLGDPEVAERKIRKGLAAGIPWRCVDFEAPLQYSGPGRSDPTSALTSAALSADATSSASRSRGRA